MNSKFFRCQQKEDMILFHTINSFRKFFGCEYAQRRWMVHFTRMIIPWSSCLLLCILSVFTLSFQKCLNFITFATHLSDVFAERCPPFCSIYVLPINLHNLQTAGGERMTKGPVARCATATPVSRWTWEEYVFLLGPICPKGPGYDVGMNKTLALRPKDMKNPTVKKTWFCWDKTCNTIEQHVLEFIKTLNSLDHPEFHLFSSHCSCLSPSSAFCWWTRQEQSTWTSTFGESSTFGGYFVQKNTAF